MARHTATIGAEFESDLRRRELEARQRGRPSPPCEQKPPFTPPIPDSSVVNQTAAAWRIAFTFLVHNGEEYLERNLGVLMSIGSSFRAFGFYYVENDSTDRTRSILASFQQQHPNRYFVGRMLDNVSVVGSSSLCPPELRNRNCNARLRLLAGLRQLGLEMVLADHDRWDAIAVVDLDFCVFPVRRYLEAFALGVRLNASAIFGSSRYADSKGSLAQYDGDVIRPRRSRTRVKEGCLAEVNSAFGGIGTYWLPQLLAANASYRWNGTQGRTYEHSLLHQTLIAHATRNGAPPPALFVDPRLKILYRWGDEGFVARARDLVARKRGRTAAAAPAAAAAAAAAPAAAAVQAALPSTRSVAAQQIERQPPATCLVNVARGPQYTPTLQLALAANKRALCAACGYRCFLHTEALSDRPAAWDKIVALQNAFASGCELCLWLDADVILRRAFSVLPMARADFTAVLDKNGLNTGVMLLRRSASADELLRRTWNATQFTHSMWWEQRAIRYVLDVTVALRERVRLLGSGLVAYPLHADERAPIFHAAGCFSSKGFRKSHCRLLLNRTLREADASFKPKHSGRVASVSEASCPLDPTADGVAAKAQPPATEDITWRERDRRHKA